MVDRVMMKVLGWSGWPLLIVFCVLVFLAPAAETKFLPIRTGQRIENVERGADRLCWDWVSVKERARVSDNEDVYIDTDEQPGAVSAVFEKGTGMPWVKSRAVGLGPHRQSYCVLLPPYTKASDTLRIRQTIYYPGYLPFWHVVVRVPDVISGGQPQL